MRDVFERIGEQVEGGGGKWVVLDADLGLDEVQESVWDSVKELVKGVDAPIEKLWDDKREVANVNTLYM